MVLGKYKLHVVVDMDLFYYPARVRKRARRIRRGRGELILDCMKSELLKNQVRKTWTAIHSHSSLCSVSSSCTTSPVIAVRQHARRGTQAQTKQVEWHQGYTHRQTYMHTHMDSQRHRWIQGHKWQQMYAPSQRPALEG